MKKLLLVFLLPFLSVFSVQPVEDAQARYEHPEIQEIGEAPLTKEMKNHIHYNMDGPNLVGYLHIEKEYHISQSTFLYVKYGLEKFKKMGASFVIVRINSFGGEIFQAVKIVDLFQKFDINEGIPLIAYIDEYAIGSAVMLALGCRFIVVNPKSIVGGNLPGKGVVSLETTSAKLRNYLISEFISMAKFYGRSPVIAQAMADPDLNIIERDGKIEKVHDDRVSLSDERASDEILSSAGDWLTLNASELLKYQVADFEVDPEMEGYDDNIKEGKTYPLDKSPISQISFIGSIPNATIYSYSNWRVSFLSFMTHPAVSSILFIITVVCFYLQINTAGFNLSGGIGLISLLLLILCSFSIQAVSSVVLVLLGLSICLILIEIFLIPGFGSIGILGIALCVISLFMLLLPGLEKFSLLDFESFAFAAGSLINRLVWLVCSLIFSFFTILFIKRFFQHKFMDLRKRVLRKEQIGDLDFLERFEEEALPKSDSRGITHSILRPIGKVVINDKLYEAISYHHETIPKKTDVIVVKHENGRLVVKELNEEKA